MKFIRRKLQTDYTADTTVTVDIGGTDYDVLLPGIAVAPDNAIEVELDDGSVIVLLGYLRK